MERVEYRPYQQPEYQPMAGSGVNKIQYSSPRGPCPAIISKQPSLPSILIDAEKKSMKYDQDLQRGLNQVYSEQRRKDSQQIRYYRY